MSNTINNTGENGYSIQSIDNSGVELSGASLAEAKLPRVIGVTSSDGFLDLGAVLNAGLGIKQVEDINQGIQGHIYSRENDVFVLRSPVGTEYNPEARRRAITGILANAKAWEAQTGVKLTEPDNGTVLFANAGETLSQAISRAFYKEQTNALVTMLSSGALKSFGFENNPELQAIAKSVEQLDSKNLSYEILKDLGVKTPDTVNLISSNFSESQLSGLPDKKFVIKADGSAGGIGVFTNQGAGYSKDELQQIVPKLVEANKLGQSFQLQEFVQGQSVGSIALFDGQGSFSLSSFHKAIEKNGAYLGTYWSKSFEEQYRDQASEIFAAISSDPALARLVGPIGFDAIVSAGELSVIEVNPRVTGATPIPFFRDKLEGVSDFRGGGFRMESAKLDIGITIPEKYFENPELLTQSIEVANERFVSEIGERNGAQPIILPQGITPFATSKVLFINDTEEGTLRERFVEVLGENDDKVKGGQ